MLQFSHVLKELEMTIGRNSGPPPKPEQLKNRKTYLEAKLEWKIKGSLCDPVVDSEIKKLEIKIAPYVLPENLKELYRWANGEQDSGFIKPGYRFNSIESSLELIESYNEIIKEYEDLPNIFTNFWPIFSTENKIDIGVFLQKDIENKSKVYGLMIWESEFVLLASSLEEYFNVMTLCRKNDVYNKGDMHENDPHKYLKKELVIFTENHSQPIYPVTNKVGVTKFLINKASTWPQELVKS